MRCLKLRRVAREDRGKTSWGESVSGAQCSALSQMQSFVNMPLRGADLIKTAVACVLMRAPVALIVAWKIVGDLRTQLSQWFSGFEAVDPRCWRRLRLPPRLRRVGTAAHTRHQRHCRTQRHTRGRDRYRSVRAAANARAFPQVSGGQVIGRISEGDQVVFLVTTADGQWYRIRLGQRYAASSRIDSANGEGWVNRSLLSQPDGTIPVETNPTNLAPREDTAVPTPTP
ncbi:MAG: SH3 domain-containing protein [Kouleothrix sp.]